MRFIVAINVYKKSHSEHKDGALVALFDPVGRQTDLSFAMSMITVQQKSAEEKTHYPTSIGTIINKMREKGSPEVIEIVEENVDTGALDSFTKEIDTEIENIKKNLLRPSTLNFQNILKLE